MKNYLMWMGAGIIVGSVYSSYKKDINKMFCTMKNKASKKVSNMVDNM